MKPIVSIIVPVYKAEPYIRKCIDSILSQTYVNWELILVDDGSPDNCGVICDQFSKCDDRIYSFHKTNGGVGSARNYGIERSNGEWIVFVDSDDFVADNYLECLLNYDLKKESFVILNFEKEKTVGSGCLKGDKMVKKLLFSSLSQLSAPYCKLFNKTILERNHVRFEEDIYMGEDAVFVLHYMNYVDEIFYDDKIGIYHYDKTTGGLHTRYFSFESEYKCFYLWKKYQECLVNKYLHSGDLCKFVWNHRLCASFYRAILSLKRQPGGCSYRKFISSLESIPNDYFENFGKYSPKKSFKRIIINYFLSVRCFRVYFLLMRFDRYK